MIQMKWRSCFLVFAALLCADVAVGEENYRFFGELGSAGIPTGGQAQSFRPSENEQTINPGESFFLGYWTPKFWIVLLLSKIISGNLKTASISKAPSFGVRSQYEAEERSRVLRISW